MGSPLSSQSIYNLLSKLHHDNEQNRIAINDGKVIYPGVPIVINTMVAPGFSVIDQIQYASVERVLSALNHISNQPVTVNIFINDLSPPIFVGSDGTPSSIHRGLFYHPNYVGVVHGSDDKTLLSYGIDPQWANIHFTYARKLIGDDRNITINFRLCSEIKNTNAFKSLVVNSVRQKRNIEAFLRNTCTFPTDAPLPPLATPVLRVSNKPITNFRLNGSNYDMSTLNTSALNIEGQHGGETISVRFDKVEWSLNPLIADEIVQKAYPANVIVKCFAYVPTDRFSVRKSGHYSSSNPYNPTRDPMYDNILYAPLPVNNGLPIVPYDGDRTIIYPAQLERVFYAGSLNASIDISHATKLKTPSQAIGALGAVATHCLPNDHLFNKANIGDWGVVNRLYEPTRELLRSHFDRSP